MNRKVIYCIIGLGFFAFLISFLVYPAFANTSYSATSTSGDFQVTLLGSPGNFHIPIFDVPLMTTGEASSVIVKLTYKGYPVVGLPTSDLPALLIYDNTGNYLSAIYFTEKGYGLYELIFALPVKGSYNLKIDAVYSLKGESVTLALPMMSYVFFFFFPIPFECFLIFIIVTILTLWVLVPIIFQFVKKMRQFKTQKARELLQKVDQWGIYSAKLAVSLIVFDYFIGSMCAYGIGLVVIAATVGVSTYLKPFRGQLQIIFELLWWGWIVGTCLFYIAGLNLTIENPYMLAYVSWQIYFWTFPISNVIPIMNYYIKFKNINKTPQQQTRGL